MEAGNEWGHVLQLTGVFAMMSLLAVGGGTAVLPEMKHVTVEDHQWLTADQFNDYYSIGQFAPGPNMQMVALIGYHVAGWPGAAAVTLAFFVPFCVLTFWVGRAWDRFAEAPWRKSIQLGLAPISIGLMLSGVYAVGHAAVNNVPTAALAIGVAVALGFTKIRPIYLMAFGGVLGLVFLR
jgi:chromate transporter